MPLKGSNKLAKAIGDHGPPLDDEAIYSAWGSVLNQLMEEMDALQKRHHSEMRLMLGTTGRRMMIDCMRVHSRRLLKPMEENSETTEQEHDTLSQDLCPPLGHLTATSQSLNILDSEDCGKRKSTSKRNSLHRSSSSSAKTHRRSDSVRSHTSVWSSKHDRTLKSIMHKASSKPAVEEECIFETSRDRILEQRSRLQRMTKSQYYEWSSGLLICLNAIFIGYQTEFRAQRVEGNSDGDVSAADIDPLHILMGSTLFTILFCIELGLRWVSDGLCGFFVTPDLSWHVFDVFVVTFSLADSILDMVTWAQAVNTSGSSNLLSNFSVLRVLRILRVAKLARVIRLMSFFRELRLMIYSILGCMKSLMWVTLILGMCLYVFGITITSGTSEYIAQNKLWAESSTVQLRQDFGTLGRSVLSLYFAMIGGRSWGEYYNELLVLPTQYRVIFLVFITFTIFAVLNIVTGVFVDSAFQANHKSRQIVIHEELEQKREYLRELRGLFSEMDINGDGSLTAEEFEARLCDERVIAFFNALKLDVTDSKTLFGILDKDGSRQVDTMEFLEGCYQLQGESRSIDTKILRMQLERLVELVWRLNRQQQSLLDESRSPLT